MRTSVKCIAVGMYVNIFCKTNWSNTHTTCKPESQFLIFHPMKFEVVHLFGQLSGLFVLTILVLIVLIDTLDWVGVTELRNALCLISYIPFESHLRHSYCLAYLDPVPTSRLNYVLTSWLNICSFNLNLEL